MHYIWKQWLEDAGLESQILNWVKKRKEKRLEIYHHQHKLLQFECLTSAIRADMFRAMKEYEEIDLEMAEFDGRMSVVRVETTKKAEKKISKEIKDMTLDERQKLIKELESMK